MKRSLSNGILCGALALAMGAQAQQAGSIYLNQVGFYPGLPKYAFVSAGQGSDRFFVLDAARRDTVFSGTLGAPKKSAYSSTVVRLADFSRFKVPGRYVLVSGGKETAPFVIDEHALDGVARASLKGYYYMRSDMPLDERYAGPWHRPAGHPDTFVLVHPSAATARRPAGSRVSVPGGWYDAGDYNKYVVNSGITVGTLLGAYEDFPRYFDSLHTNIPASGLPDLLAEARYNIAWMLTMQDEDGGVYHKCTNAAFDGMVMPGVTKAPRYVVQKSTAATLDFAAVLAAAARVYRAFPKTRDWADTCLRAAESAWRWALRHPADIYSQNNINKEFQPPITTGEYGDRSFRDEWLWAASELLATTRKTNYLDTVRAHLADPPSLPGWSDVGLMGYGTLVRHYRHLPAAKAILDTFNRRLLDMATSLVSATGITAFHTVMGHSPRDFVWGSSSVAANQGMVLIWAYMRTGHQAFLDGALDNLDYLLGRNATGYCFLTGMGSRSTMHPHHRPSVADGIEAPVPGLLAGGPNPGRQDHCLYPFTEIETSYADVSCSYASNEIAINWNAPLVYLASAIEAIASQRTIIPGDDYKGY